MRETQSFPPAVLDYIARLGVREHPVLERCRAETLALGDAAVMQIAPDQGALLAMLVRVTGARRILEVGTFTGYSALAMALALPADGQIMACDVSEEYTAHARAYWRDAGVADRITLHIGPAADTLDTFLTDGHAETFDLMFIDADKTGYDTYYEQALTLLRPGGLILIDNVLWSGRVADPAETDANTQALRALNAKIHGDERVDMALVPVADGLTMARKR